MYHSHPMGKRRAVLLAAAAYCGTRAFAYIPRVRVEPPQEPIVMLTGGHEWLLLVYVTAWAQAGAFCLAALRRGRILLPLSLVVGLMTIWSLAWLIGWAHQPHTLWWQTAGTYGLPAIMVATLVALTPRDRPDEDEAL